jgi:polyisoprenoid-binding protein YceI
MSIVSRRSDRPDPADERGGIVRVLLVVVVVLGAAGFAGYWFLIRSDAPPKPSITATETTGGTSVDGAWALPANDAEGSFVQYRINEKFAAGLVDNTASGKSTDVTGAVKVDGTTVSDITITANLAALHSDKDFRDRALQSRGLETDRFPKATFTASGPITLASSPKQGATVSVDVPGDLTLHGTTKSVTLPVEARWDGRRIQIVGDLPIVLADYDIAAPSGGPIASIEDHGSLEFKVFFTKAS